MHVDVLDEDAIRSDALAGHALHSDVNDTISGSSVVSSEPAIIIHIQRTEIENDTE